MGEDTKIVQYQKSHQERLVEQKKSYSIKFKRVKIDREKINKLIEEVDRPIAEKLILRLLNVYSC